MRKTLVRLVAWAVAAGAPVIALAQDPTPAPPPPISRTDLLRETLPPGNYRNIQAVVIELQPGAMAALHRHDVGVFAYVLEGEIENRFNGGASRVHRAGESWWEAPGTVHDVARNPSATAKTRFVVVYVGEEGKANTVPLSRPPE